MFKKILVNIIFVVLIIILGISISPVLPFKNIPHTYVVVSGSMEPTIKTGSIVLTKPVNPKLVKTGDIVAFSSPSNSKDVILHRVTGIKSEFPLRFSTKGDNNNTPDSWDLMDVGILGQYVFAVPYVGKVAGFVRTPIGFSLIIVLPVLLFIISQILNIKKYIKEEVDKQVNSKTLNTIFILFSAISLSSVFFTKSISAKFTTQVSVTNISFIMQDDFDVIAPVTEIINLPYQTNQKSITIEYTSPDTDIDHTDLCYSFNLGDYFCQNSLNFNFNNGDGTYYFYTQATDKSGNTESAKPDYSVGIIYDTTPPTTNLINPSAPFFTGQNLLTNNLFEQDFYLPQNYSGNLEFSYRFISNDIASNDHFDVGIYFQDGIKLIKKIITDGNNTTSPGYDSGWQNISHSLTDLSNRLLKLVISVTDTGDGVGYDSSVTINNLKITSLDIRTGDTSPPQFLSLDLGSGIGTSFTDLAGNIESPHSTPVVILPPVVLNKISSSTVSLYNNTDSVVDLSNYTIDTGTTTVLTGTILPHSSYDIPLSIGTTLVKLLNNSSVVDSTSFETLGSSTWQRSSDGLGPWIMYDSPLSFDLTSRLSDSKITLSVFGTNITTNRDYEIIYTSNGVEKGFGGTLLPEIISQDFFLGTCSTGTCLPALNIGSSFVVTFSGINKTFILTP